MLSAEAKRRLIWHGVLIFIFGLAAGAVTPWLTNPRMGLAAHIGGVMSGILLIVIGLIWEEIKLPGRAKKVNFWCFLYASHTGWLGQFLAGLFGTSRSTPIGGAGFAGTAWQEAVVDFVTGSFSIAILLAGILTLWGLRGRSSESHTHSHSEHGR